MVMAKVDFGPRPNGLTRSSFEDLIHCYLAAMLHNCQIQHDYNLAWMSERLVAYTLVPTRNAMENTFDCEYVTNTFDAILTNGGIKPVWEMLDSEGRDESSQWEASSEFVLFTHMLDKSSPVVGLDSHLPMAIISLPLDHMQRDALYGWTMSYRELDSIWMGCSRLAIYAYQEMANATSELSKTGREICQFIEIATGKPTYYFLMKYWISPSESQVLYCNNDDLSKPGRLCPGCGDHWRRRKLEILCSSQYEWYDFAYRCEQCRLVSNEAHERGRRRHWRHGEGTAKGQERNGLKETINE